MTEEQLNQLTVEENLKVTQFLIADLAGNILGEDAAIAKKARHEIGALAMTFSNLHQLIKSERADNSAIVKIIYEKYRYQNFGDEATS